ncbi:MAG: hypothetical protein Q8903_08655 [Bacteroidota bacterium]|nr:hypothetical protein [Bacteroidota bacterium]
MRKIKNELNHIGKLRISAGYERKDAAIELGCTIQFLCQIEKINSEKGFSSELAIKMANLYKCTTDEVLLSRKRAG